MASRSRRLPLDLATVLGIGGGVLLLALAIGYGGSARAFLHLPSALIVVGGTLSTVTVCFSLAEIGRTVAVLGKAIFHAAREPAQAALRVIRLSELARKNGILSMQGAMGEFAAERFLHKGLGMVVDGASAEDIDHLLRRDIQATQARHAKAAGVLRKAADIAPAMGLIGTLIGLVQMLGSLDDPAAIGPSMAVALLTTFYGAVLANMVFAPLAAKLERNSAEEALIAQLYLMGAVSISRQENPRRLEMLLNSVLPPPQRVQYFD